MPVVLFMQFAHKKTDGNGFKFSYSFHSSGSLKRCHSSKWGCTPTLCCLPTRHRSGIGEPMVHLTVPLILNPNSSMPFFVETLSTNPNVQSNNNSLGSTNSPQDAAAPRGHPPQSPTMNDQLKPLVQHPLAYQLVTFPDTQVQIPEAIYDEVNNSDYTSILSEAIGTPQTQVCHVSILQAINKKLSWTVFFNRALFDLDPWHFLFLEIDWNVDQLVDAHRFSFITNSDQFCSIFYS